MAKMAKVKQNGANKAKSKTTTQQKIRILRAKDRGLDAMAEAYKRLLLDPCGAPLAYPVWGSADGSFLIKCESIGTVGFSATETNGALLFSPGTLSSTAKSSLVGFTTTGAGVDVNLVTNVGGTVTDWTPGTFNPGVAFLGANASVVRPVAACVELVYAGSESSRAGMVAGGVIPGGAWYENTAISADKLHALVPHAERTPVNKIEFLWYPSEADNYWQDPSSPVAAQQVDRRNSVAVSWANIPANSGFRVKLTAVYEYKPKIGINVAIPQVAPSSHNTMAEVLSDVARSISKPWVRSAAQQLFVQAVQYTMTRGRDRPRITHGELR